ncbi:MAG: hypothetical protein RLZZ337_1397 [Bacteroidota bacterium]|jgi:cell division protein FtsL
MKKISLILYLCAFYALALGQVADEYEVYEEEDVADEYYENEMTVEEAFEFEVDTKNEWKRPIDEKFKEKYTGEEYNYWKKQPPKKQERSRVITAEKSINISGFLKIIFNIFLAVAIGIVVYVLYMLLKDFKFTRSQKIENPNTDSEEETELKVETLDKNDLEQQIALAKESGNYTLATRFYFLLYLQKLQLKEYITYHIDKTNYDYKNELPHEDLHIQFTKVSYLFEYVWYGKKPIDETSFSILENTFKTQIDLVK